MNSVLIVEDEKMIRQGIKSMVQRSGVPVNTIMECNNGQMALEILGSQKIDVMFTDIRMPKMDGIELVEKMQELSNIPRTVVISGYDDFSYAVRMLRKGVKEYILKPVDRDQITEILKRLNTEIEKADENAKEMRNIGYQQLKYLILNENITPEELNIMSNQFEEQLFQEEYVVCCLENQSIIPENDKIIFLNDVDDNSIFITAMEHKELLLKNELRNRHTGVSSVHRGLAQLIPAYKEAKEARREAFRLCSNREEYDSRHLPGTEIESGTIEQIAQIIGTDKIEDALHKLERLSMETKRGKIAIQSFAENMTILIDMIQTTYQNVILMDEENLSLFKNIYGFPCLDDYMEALTEWIISFHEKINVHFDDYKNKQKIQQAIAYIQENYQGDVNMAVVSNHISMNYSLFSYVFKQYTGNNFVNYLKNLRINEAKRLLVETDYRIVEISQKVGYENEKHFMKTFKTICGVSPTEYRKNMQYTK